MVPKARWGILLSTGFFVLEKENQVPGKNESVSGEIPSGTVTGTGSVQREK